MYKCLPASVGSDIFPGPHTVYEAVQGVVPLEWTTILQRCRVCSVVLEVGKFFVSTAHEAIWKPQCVAQIAHEHQHMITQQLKMWRQEHGPQPECRKQVGVRVTYLVHAHAGMCPSCHLSLAIHTGGVVPH